VFVRDEFKCDACNMPSNDMDLDPLIVVFVLNRVHLVWN